jgi:two-component SAPR family response regulator
MYKFNVQLKLGEKGEMFLDKFFSEEYLIKPVSMGEQRKGIDRIFEHKRTGRVLKVEYKTDELASGTGNAFIETISVDSTNKPGWAYSSKADYLLYYVTGDELIYIITLNNLRKNLEKWEKKYRKAKAKNDGYYTHGILVPLREFEIHAEQVLSV